MFNTMHALFAVSEGSLAILETLCMCMIYLLPTLQMPPVPEGKGTNNGFKLNLRIWNQLKASINLHCVFAFVCAEC